MTELPDNIPLWASIIVVFFLLLGSFVIVVGTLGLLRLRNFYQRIHGPAITITLGTGSILIASMVLFSSTQERFVIHELLITLLVFMTAPLGAMMIMRAAVYRGLRKKQRLRDKQDVEDSTKQNEESQA